LKARGEEHYRQVAIENILAKPDANPELFGWAAKNILEKRWEHLGEAITRIMIIEELLSLLTELEDMIQASSDKDQVAALKNHATKLRTLLNESNGKYVKEAAKECTVEEARRVLHMIRLHDGLSHQLKHHLESILANEHKELRKVSRLEEEEEKKKPAYHYTTSASLDRKRQELSQLRADTQAMASVIEAARELGDLKENAEYHAAKDRQKLLMQQAAELEELIARARVVEERDAHPETTHFGTRAILRHVETGEVRDITIMGMWEADIPRGIISYLTPLGSQLLNHRVGEVLDLITGEGTSAKFRLEEIHPASTAALEGSAS
jgi:transcription elongation GreA/GreB family factor